MKKSLFPVFGLILAGLLLGAQEFQHDSVVINIEVPVRVFKGVRFIDDLSIEDFEIYEEGRPQKLEAVYLIKKTKVFRKEFDEGITETKKQFAPQLSRHFVLVFEVIDYLPHFDKILREFFTEVIRPGDSLVVMTPQRTLNMKIDALKKIPPEVTAKQLKSLLRRDILRTGAKSHRIIKDILRLIAESMRGQRGRNPAMLIMEWESYVEEWLSLKVIQKKNLLNFADYLKGIEGQKHVFLFYQKEVLPEYKVNLMDPSIDQKHPHYFMKLNDFFFNFNSRAAFNIDHIKEAFSDSSISSHFLYLTHSRHYMLEPDLQQSVARAAYMAEKSNDIFNAFKEVADATGGIVDTSANPSYLFQRAVETSENYYLLYYSPKNYRADGQFRNIEVKVKGKRYKVLHRAGYIAD